MGPGEDASAYGLDEEKPGMTVAETMDHVNWAATPLGDRSQWPPALHTMVRVLIGSRFSMWMAWGDELTFFCNDAYARDTLGVKYPWALGQPASQVWAEIWDDIEPRIRQVLETGDATWDEDLLLFLERSGYREETYHTFSYSPLFDQDRVVGMLCVVSEETERVIGERRMATLRDLGGAFASSMTTADVGRALRAHLGANVWDLPISLTYLSNEDRTFSLCAATGWDGGDSPRFVDDASHGWPIDDMRVGEMRMIERLEEHLSTVPTWAWDAPPSRAAVVAFGDASQSEPAGFLVAGVDPFRAFDADYQGFISLIAAQIGAAVLNARAFGAERRRAEALAELDRAKTTFFTNISHEFRTPLTLLLSPLDDLLQADRLDVEDREQIDLAHRNALRLLKLVNALLDFSRIEAGRLRADVEPSRIGTLTAEIAGMFRAAIEQGGIQLIVSCREPPTPVLVDPHMWELIVTNLVSNAFKHTFEGWIEVRLSCTDAAITLDVIDTGIGIPANELPQLFGRFHRVEGAESRSHEGSGVGLSLVKDLVQLHGGTVTVESEVERGTTFSVCIPLVAAPVAVGGIDAEHRVQRRREPSRGLAAHVAEARQWADGTTIGTPGASPSPSAAATVLIVDDNADMRAYVSRLLSERYSVVTVANGAQALAQVEITRPDLVISDVMMPEMNGMDLLRMLRSDESTADIPVILLSARAGPESSVEGLEIGADDYLVKPFSADELLARVAARLNAGTGRRRERVLSVLRMDLQDLREIEDIAAVAHRHASELLGHDQTFLAVPAGASLRVEFHPVPPQGVAPRYHTIGMESGHPLARAVRDGAVARASSSEQFRLLFPEFAADHQATGMAAAVVQPVFDRIGRRVGALGVAWSSDRIVDAATAGLVDSIGAIVGQALERLAFLDQERRIAAAIQNQLLEVDVRTTVAAVTAHYRPGDASMIVGGDWYDMFSLDPDRVGLVVGDVVGHGLPAALVMGKLRSAVASSASVTREPAEVLAMVDPFARRTAGGACATATYAVLERVAGEGGGATLAWCSAGHPPLLVVDGDTVEVLWEGRRSPLGVPGVHVVTEGRRRVGPGALVVLYTDGLIERRSESIDVGIDRLCRAVSEHRLRPIVDLCDRVVDALTPQDASGDDLVVAIARVAGSTSTSFVDVIEANSASLRDSRERLRAWLVGARRVANGAAEDILLAIGEAVANAIEHGSLDRSSSVSIEIHADGTSYHASVSDTGVWSVDSSQSVRRGRGRGLGIMEHLAGVRIRRSRLGSTALLEFMSVEGIAP
ncbi:MAG: SpoIIE family protein phosphatase [Acidimicrobiia bacterium]